MKSRERDIKPPRTEHETHADSATISVHLQREEIIMGACQCGYSTDPEKNCNGTHKVVQAVKADIAEKLAANGFPHASEYVKNN